MHFFWLSVLKPRLDSIKQWFEVYVILVIFQALRFAKVKQSAGAMLVEAGQPEILRASQRDDTFRKKFSEIVSEIFRSLCGNHFWIKYKDPVERLSNVLYHLMTTMSNIQTLGEEYTGIVQVDSLKKSLPRKYLQFLMILLNNYGEKVVIETLQKFEKRIEILPEEHQLQHSARRELIKMSKVLKTCIPFISKFHKALFYFNGHFYEIGNRICGIKYVLVRYWLKDRTSLLAFKFLGAVTITQSILGLFFSAFQYNNKTTEKVFESKFNESNNVCDKCSLCLNVRQHTSVTPCGHLFCWSCIIPWLQEQPKCPLCRQVFQPSRVVFLQNYSLS